MPSELRSLPTPPHPSAIFYPCIEAVCQEQIEFQQFSTPAPIAYLAALAARIAATDLVLEPPAGTGLLAAFAHRAGACLVLNGVTTRKRLLRTLDHMFA